VPHQGLQRPASAVDTTRQRTDLLDRLLDVLSEPVQCRAGVRVAARLEAQGGEPDRVLEMRCDFQRMMKARYTEMIEQLTDRRVLAFLSQAPVEPDLTIEIFLMDGPLPGFGALELVDRQPTSPGSGAD
jgi:hypothetical protein